MEREREAVVIDNGSDSCRVGIAGDDSPTATIPSVIQIPGSHKLHYPVENGIVSDWGAMEKIWHKCYYK